MKAIKTKPKRDPSWVKKSRGVAKQKRSGIYARSQPVVFGRVHLPDRTVLRLQTPFTVDVGPSVDGDKWPIKNNGRNLSITRCAYRGVTAIRHAFEQLPLRESRTPLGNVILRSLLRRHRSPGTFVAGGWRVLRDRSTG